MPMLFITLIPLFLTNVVTIYFTISYFINSFYSGKFINYSSLDQIKDIRFIVFVNLITASFMWFLNNFFKDYFSDFFALLIFGVLFLAIYIGVSKIFKLEAFDELTRILKKLR